MQFMAADPNIVAHRVWGFKFEGSWRLGLRGVPDGGVAWGTRWLGLRGVSDKLGLRGVPDAVHGSGPEHRRAVCGRLPKQSIDLRTTSSQNCTAVPRRARI
jgi:hypothetical protein